MDNVEVLDGAKWVRVDRDNSYILAWFGGVYIHVYTDEYTEISCFSCNDDAPDISYIDSIMESHIKENYYP